MIQSFLACALLFFLVPSSDAESVLLCQRSMPLAFDESVSGTFNTNRVARELTAYFSVAESESDLFPTNGILPGGLTRMKPLAPLSPPMRIAENIRYDSQPDEKIVVGMEALSFLLEAIDQASALSNEWSQAESLLEDLFTGRITNDLARVRTVFSADGNPWPEMLDDEELTDHILSFWMQCRLFSPSLLTWRMVNDPQGGTECPAVLLAFRKENESSSFIYKTALFRQQGAWRILIPAF